MKIIRAILFASFLFFFVFSVNAQQTVQKMVVETQYLLYLPEQYNTDTARKWPLLMFLHGSGESGDNIEKVKAHGPPKLVAQGKKFPFIVVSPQAEAPSGWDAGALYKLLQDVKKKYRVDHDKVYLTGLSMGGYGTFDVAMKHPEEFAAIAPVCGGGDTTDAWKMRNVPIWCFHGALDEAVRPSQSINMVKAASRYNPKVRFTLYADKNHNSWDTTYNTNDSLYDWLLSQTRFRYKETNVSPAILKKYEGWYVLPSDNDTVGITVKGNALFAIAGRDTIPLKAASENLFFFQPGRTMDLRFETGKNGVSGFRFMGRTHGLYRRISAGRK